MNVAKLHDVCRNIPASTDEPKSTFTIFARGLSGFVGRALPVLLSLVLLGSALAKEEEVNGITIDTALSQARRGVAYSHTVPVISGGTAPYTFALSGGLTLPPNLNLSSSGLVSGVISCKPQTNGNYGQDITVTDSSSTPIVATFTGNKGLSINVTAGPGTACVSLLLSPATITVPMVGSPYSQTISVTNGIGPYTYAISAGTLPAGLTLNATTGHISGTPTSGGAYNFTITATDAADSTGSVTYSGTVNPAIVVNPALLPGGTVGTPYSQTVTATGGSGAKTLSLAGSLPAGLSFNATSGLISGAPTTAATSSFSITATDGNGATGTQSYTVTINAAVVVSTPSLLAATVGNPYSQNVVATGGTGSYTFAVTSGALPSGLSLSTAGLISGTPTSAGSSSVTITATDGNGAAGSRPYTLTVHPVLAVSPTSLAAGTVGIAYSQTVSASGGTGPYTFAVTGGALPAGLSLSTTTGLIGGTPTSTSPNSFTITATDSNGATGSHLYSVAINASITVSPSSLPNGTAGSPYSQTVSATGGAGGFTFSVSSGALPAGLALSGSTGVLSGTPSSAGSSSFTIAATDSNGATGSQAYSVTINAPIAVNPPNLPGGTVGTPYNQTVTATGGNGSYTFSASVGSLPAGLSLNPSTGVISGTPTTAATSNFSLTATDGNGATGTQSYTVTINAAVVVSTPSLPAATAGTPYSQNVVATGGTGSYSFSVSAGSLPAGLTLSPSTGVISGTPTTAATSNFTITATDGNGTTGSRAYTVVVNPAIVVSPLSLPGGTVGTGYSQNVTATGGSGSHTFSVSAGALPAGLSLNGLSGLISGTPSSSGTNSFTITATDGTGATGSRAYSVTINTAIAVAPTALPNGTVGVAY